MENNKFKCGCVENDLSGFGRGAARTKRIAMHLDRDCPSCFSKKVFEAAETMKIAYKKDENGDWVYYTGQEYVAKKIKQRACYKI